MKILKLVRVGAAALAVFSVCDRSVAAPPVQCPDVPGLWTLPFKLPVYWDRPDSPKFTYRFQIQPATGRPPAEAPFGIVLSGGAGAPSIGTAAGTIFPDTFNVIYTDVRGAGCNLGGDPQGGPFPADALTTEYFSRDVLALVRTLRLPAYVLYGVSYGTVHATVMTHIAQSEGIQAPSAIVLEGILGNWWINEREVDDYNREWNTAKSLLPPGVVSTFQASSSPYGISSSDWMLLLTKTLNAGTTRLLGNNTYFWLHRLDTADQDEFILVKALIQAEIARIKEGFRSDTARVANILHCTETQHTVYTKDLVNGEIVNTGEDKCAGWHIPFLRPYDSRLYPVVNVPIYYFEGSQDPNTSPANAHYHFEHQTQTDRLYLLVSLGGHTDLSGTLHQMGCTPGIFEAIAMNNGPGLQAALEQCRWRMLPERLRPGE